jgi:hypothetical protein
VWRATGRGSRKQAQKLGGAAGTVSISKTKYLVEEARAQTISPYWIRAICTCVNIATASLTSFERLDEPLPCRLSACRRDAPLKVCYCHQFPTAHAEAYCWVGGRWEVLDRGCGWHRGC